jgi:hypothetical protein
MAPWAHPDSSTPGFLALPERARLAGERRGPGARRKIFKVEGRWPGEYWGSVRKGATRFPSLSDPLQVPSPL